MKSYKFLVLLGYGVVSSLALSIFIYLLPALFPRYYSEKNWTLGRELSGILGACLLIAIGNCFYTAWVFGSFILSWKGFLISLAWVAVLAPFPIVLFLMWNRNLQLTRNLKEATEINYALAKRENVRNEEQTEEVWKEERSVQLVFSGGTKEMLEVDAHTLLYIEAEGNYIKITYSRADNKIQQKLVRATMKQAEEAVAVCPFIVRCHRAFLVNIRTVVKVDGNSQGYRLRLEGCTEEVPVSRGYAKEIKRLIEGDTKG